ncbi:MAG: type IX secretion system membrane protein PorP/SprF [Flectobacillus sp.]|nr:type IX secretion system membrane protein PorP/SprF [Flectobacillus sp.]
MLKKGVLLITILLVWVMTAEAQDPQLSQFYAAPLYLNPAFAGSAMAPRVNFTHRNQWPSLSANFVTSSLSADMHLSKLNSGVGILFTSDRQFSNFTTMDIGAVYSYHLKLSDNLSAQMGVQGTYETRGLNYSEYTFGDQIKQYLQGLGYGSTTDPIGTGSPQLRYWDFSTGGIIYSEQFWVGVSVHHLNRPNQSFSNQDARLPMKFGLQAGFRIPIADYELGNNLGGNIDREKSITPVIHYKHQGTADQLDVGAYLTYSPLVFGAWYRGLPIKNYSNGSGTIINHDAAVLLLGYRQDNFSIGYSYDATISALSGTGGAHELTLSYTFTDWIDNSPRNRKRKGELKCPKF